MWAGGQAKGKLVGKLADHFPYRLGGSFKFIFLLISDGQVHKKGQLYVGRC